MRRLLGYERVLVVTAVAAERAAVLDGLGIDDAHDDDLELGRPILVAAAGVGPAAAAALTARYLAVAAYQNRWIEAVLSVGIGGGFADRVPVGGVVLATASVAADLGAETPDGYLGVDELGFGTVRHDTDTVLLRHLSRALPAAVAGPVLTVSTVTGTADRAAALGKRHPEAVAEAMEGFGVATATHTWPGVAFGEIRAVSNAVGPRDRSAWRIPEALAALRTVFGVLATL